MTTDETNNTRDRQYAQIISMDEFAELAAPESDAPADPVIDPRTQPITMEGYQMLLEDAKRHHQAREAAAEGTDDAPEDDVLEDEARDEAVTGESVTHTQPIDCDSDLIASVVVASASVELPNSGAHLETAMQHHARDLAPTLTRSRLLLGVTCIAVGAISSVLIVKHLFAMF